MSRESREPVLSKTPPERRPAPGIVLASPGCGCCCCCCCCCLHSVGSLIGGIVASNFKDQPDPDARYRPELPSTDVSVARLYWWILTLMTLVGFIIPLTWMVLTTYSNYGGYYTPMNRLAEAFGVGIGTVLVMWIGFLPAMQLLASLVALFVIQLQFTDRGPALRRLGSLTAWSLVGTLAGIGVMIGIAAMFSVF